VAQEQKGGNNRMKNILTIAANTARSVYSKTWLEPELKEFVRGQAHSRGLAESQMIRWFMIRGINSVPELQVTEEFEST
jgi:hypothetical protein